jgi:hypothetical protein
MNISPRKDTPENAIESLKSIGFADESEKRRRELLERRNNLRKETKRERPASKDSFMADIKWETTDIEEVGTYEINIDGKLVKIFANDVKNDDGQSIGWQVYCSKNNPLKEEYPDSVYGFEKKEKAMDKMKEMIITANNIKRYFEKNERPKNTPHVNKNTTEKYKYTKKIEEIAEILKNQKISEVVVAGETYTNPETKEKKIKFAPDLDTKTALYIFNNYNNKPLDEIYQEGSFSTIVKKGESENGISDGKIKTKNLESVEKNKNGVKVYVDAGGRWVSIDKEGKVTTIYIDHHGSGLRNETSGTKMVIEIMEKANLLKEMPEWLKKFADFVNNVDNLSYAKAKNNKGGRIFNENYFRNEWPDSLFALAEKRIPFNKLIELCKSGKIKDPSRPFTEEELDGELGNIVVGEMENKKTGEMVKQTIRDLCRNERRDVNNAIDAIKKSEEHNEERGLILNTKELGKIVYHDYFRIKTKNGRFITNKIIDHIAIKAAVVRGNDSFVSWNTEKKKFFISSINSKDLPQIANRINSTYPNCCSESRGTFIFGNIPEGMTEEKFLKIIGIEQKEKIVVKNKQKEEATENNEEKEDRENLINDLAEIIVDILDEEGIIDLNKIEKIEFMKRRLMEELELNENIASRLAEIALEDEETIVIPKKIEYNKNSPEKWPGTPEESDHMVEKFINKAIGEGKEIFFSPFPDPDGFFWNDKMSEKMEDNSGYVITKKTNSQKAEFMFLPSEGKYKTENTLSAIVGWENKLRPVCDMKFDENTNYHKKIIQQQNGTLKLEDNKWKVSDKLPIKIDNYWRKPSYH